MRRLIGKRRDPAPIRRPVPTHRRRNRVQATLLLAAGAAVICGPIWLSRSGTTERALTALQSALVGLSADFGLRVETVTVTGGVETEPAEVMALLEIRRGAPIFALAPSLARQRIESLPWVAHAAVERRLPGDIRIEIEEHLPLAIWQNDGRIRMIDAEGGIIDVEPPRRFTHLPVVVGPDAPGHALDLIRLLGTELELARQVAAAIRVGGRRWNLEFESGISVQLPEHDATAAWRRLAVLAREERLLERDITAIDLRFHPGKPVIRGAPEAPLVAQQEGKET